ncbi:MAG: flagellar basal body P-ring protein FlgI [Planctomycetes bacterium]|nr:flagellar basal body P-ring protein FlgI [Planctomycetota bacterium]
MAVDPSQAGSTKLQVLVAALNAVKVPTEDIIEIIKRLERSGQLHGWLIIE